MRGNVVKVIVVVAMITVLAVGFLGYISTGFKSTDYTFAPEGGLSVKLSDVQECLGWQLHYTNNKDATDGVDAVRAVFAYDKEVIKEYEEQGYKVEVGVIVGVGANNSTGYRYNKPSGLSLVSRDGKLYSKTERADLILVYSSDEEAKPVGWYDWSLGDDSHVYSVATYEFAEGENPNAYTYVATAFIRLISESGTIRTAYCPAREVLCVDPLVFGEK